MPQNWDEVQNKNSFQVGKKKQLYTMTLYCVIILSPQIN